MSRACVPKAQGARPCACTQSCFFAGVLFFLSQKSSLDLTQDLIYSMNIKYGCMQWIGQISSELDKFQVICTSGKVGQGGQGGQGPGEPCPPCRDAGKPYPSIQDCIFTHSEAHDDGLGRARTMNVWTLSSASMWSQHILYITLWLINYKMLFSKYFFH